jgi:hypothetical protein
MNSKIHKIYFEPTTKVNVSGGYERLSTNGYVQDYDTLFWDANSSNALSNAAQCGEAQFFYPPRLHRPLIPVPPALTGAAITVLAFAEPFIAAGAAVGFIRFCLLFFKGPHGLVVPPRLGPFFLQKKVRPLRL